MSIPCTEYKYILPSYSKYELESGHSTDTKRINYHFVASPSKLELAIFLAQLRIIDISTKNLHGRVIPSGYFATLWLHLANWNLQDSQLS